VGDTDTRSRRVEDLRETGLGREPGVGVGLRRRAEGDSRGRKEARPDAARTEAKDLVPSGDERMEGGRGWFGKTAMCKRRGEGRAGRGRQAVDDAKPAPPVWRRVENARLLQ
jgi:hypothetical protein